MRNAYMIAATEQPLTTQDGNDLLNIISTLFRALQTARVTLTRDGSKTDYATVRVIDEAIRSIRG